MQKAVTGPIDVHVDVSGPEHQRTFVTSVRADTRTASATATSKKASRNAAIEAWVRAWAPGALTHEAERKTAPPQLPHLLPNATEEVGSDLMTAFELPRSAPPLVLQALLHSSWTHENRAVAQETHQRSYEVLAVEGSHLLHALRTHQQAISTLSSTLEPTADDVRALTPEQADVAELSASLDLPRAILIGRGQERIGLSERIIADSAQAVVAAAWRADPGMLTVRQPIVIADWVADFDPRNDATTLLTSHLLEPLGLHPEVTWQSRGASHAEEHRARWTWAGASWVGPWQTSRRKAKQSLAREVLSLVYAFDDGEFTRIKANEARVLASFINAAVARLEDPITSPRQRAIAGSRVAMSAALAGAVDEQGAWASQAERVLGAAGFSDTETEALGSRLRGLYAAQQATDHLARLAGFVDRQRRVLQTSQHWLEPVAALLTLAEYLEVLDVATGAKAVRLAESPLARHIPPNGELDNLAVPATSAAILERLLRAVNAIAAASRSTTELDVSVDGGGVAVTMRVAGVHLGETLDEALDAAGAVVKGLDIGAASGAVSIVVPAVADRARGPLTMDDSWAVDTVAVGTHERLRNALDDLLDLLTDPESVPSMDEVRTRVGTVGSVLRA